MSSTIEAMDAMDLGLFALGRLRTIKGQSLESAASNLAHQVSYLDGL
jgi:hypothetical protein